MPFFGDDQMHISVSLFGCGLGMQGGGAGAQWASRWLSGPENWFILPSKLDF